VCASVFSSGDPSCVKDCGVHVHPAPVPQVTLSTPVIVESSAPIPTTSMALELPAPVESTSNEVEFYGFAEIIKY